MTQLQESATIHAVIAPIITSTYGDTIMAREFAGHLANKINAWPDTPTPSYGARSREDMVRLTCWDWFSGGGTATGVARRIEEALG